jgi:hypothetical protein
VTTEHDTLRPMVERARELSLECFDLGSRLRRAADQLERRHDVSKVTGDRDAGRYGFILLSIEGVLNAPLRPKSTDELRDILRIERGVAFAAVRALTAEGIFVRVRVPPWSRRHTRESEGGKGRGARPRAAGRSTTRSRASDGARGSHDADDRGTLRRAVD